MFIGTFQLSSSTACWFRQECQNAEASGLSRSDLAEALYNREQLSSRAAAQKLLPKLAALLVLMPISALLQKDTDARWTGRRS